MYCAMHVKEASQSFKQESTANLSISCGLKVQTMLRPVLGYIVLIVEHTQFQNMSKFETMELNDVLKGSALNEKAVGKSTKPKDDITLALLKIFDTFMPIPTANVFANPRWKSSVFSDIG